MREQLADIERRFEEVTQQMSAPETASDSSKLRELGRERARLETVVEAWRRLQRAEAELEGAKQLLGTGDADLEDMAKAEVKALTPRVEELTKELELALLPRDPMDGKDVVLEIRAGAGGDEAALFAGELFECYQRYASQRGWRFDTLSSNPGTAGGYKEIIASIEGEEVFAHLKFEGGVHRVQRVPATESQGRIHTSTVTVAVMPEAEEVEVELDANDLRIDVFRAGGHGGQSVNTTDSAVRIVHLPTQTTVICQDEKSQHKNKAKAMKVLLARLSDLERSRADEELGKQRRSMVGTGDRSEKVRTYNFPQDRVSDHRIGLTLRNLPKLLHGDLEPLISALRTHERAELLKSGQADES